MFISESPVFRSDNIHIMQHYVKSGMNRIETVILGLQRRQIETIVQFTTEAVAVEQRMHA